ncbi:cystatin-B-like [Gastrophryne carolinensis]
MPIVCGGAGETKAAGPEVQELCDQVKAEVEEKHGQKFNTYVATEYRTQVVSGTNYFVKIDVGGDECVHVRIHKALPHQQGKVTLHSVQGGKTKEEAIAYF